MLSPHSLNNPEGCDPESTVGKGVGPGFAQWEAAMASVMGRSMSNTNLHDISGKHGRSNMKLRRLRQGFSQGWSTQLVVLADN